MGMDYAEFQVYRDNFVKMSRMFDQWLTEFLNNEGLRFLAKVKPRTPVDTGDLRNHWELTAITRKGDILEIEFINPMEYATFVEYGHAKPYKSGATEGSPDWVEGYFMMTISVDEIERQMPKRFDKDFVKFLESLGVG